MRGFRKWTFDCTGRAEKCDLDFACVVLDQFFRHLLDDECGPLSATGEIIAEKRNSYFIVTHVWRTLIVARLCNTGGIADSGCPVGDFFRYSSPRPDECVFADGDARQNSHVRADGRTLLYKRKQHFPVPSTCHRAICINGPRLLVVGKHDSMTDKAIVLYSDTLADERV